MTTPQFRPAAPMATCAAEPCDTDATWEGLHCPPNDPSRVWVPLCNTHFAAVAQGTRVAYVTEVHGWINPEESAR